MRMKGKNKVNLNLKTDTTSRASLFCILYCFGFCCLLNTLRPVQCQLTTDICVSPYSSGIDIVTAACKCLPGWSGASCRVCDSNRVCETLLKDSDTVPHSTTSDHAYIYECDTSIYTATRDTITYGTCESDNESLENIIKGKPFIQFTNTENRQFSFEIFRISNVKEDDDYMQAQSLFKCTSTAPKFQTLYGKHVTAAKVEIIQEIEFDVKADNLKCELTCEIGSSRICSTFLSNIVARIGAEIDAEIDCNRLEQTCFIKEALLNKFFNGGILANNCKSGSCLYGIVDAVVAKEVNFEDISVEENADILAHIDVLSGTITRLESLQANELLAQERQKNQQEGIEVKIPLTSEEKAAITDSVLGCILLFIVFIMLAILIHTSIEIYKFSTYKKFCIYFTSNESSKSSFLSSSSVMSKEDHQCNSNNNNNKHSFKLKFLHGVPNRKTSTLSSTSSKGSEETKVDSSNFDEIELGPLTSKSSNNFSDRNNLNTTTLTDNNDNNSHNENNKNRSLKEEGQFQSTLVGVPSYLDTKASSTTKSKDVSSSSLIFMNINYSVASSTASSVSSSASSFFNFKQMNIFNKFQTKSGGNLHHQGDKNQNKNIQQQDNNSIDNKISKKKIILQNIHGVAKNKEVLAIMGPSGSGKSTLLDILAKKTKGGNLSGQIQILENMNSSNETTTQKHPTSRMPSITRLISRKETAEKKQMHNEGEPSISTNLGREKSTMEKTKNKVYQSNWNTNLIGFVDQSDYLLGTSTVYESLLFSAILRHDITVPMEEKAQMVKNVMKQMHISHIADSRIGSANHRGISGGEKRRVSVGMELIKQPLILLLDEPTSGLDSYHAYTLMRSLKSLSQDYGTAIIVTIHQPRSNIYNLFDSLLVLYSGRTAYYGKRKEIQSYFASINKPLPLQTNPAEFLIDILFESDEEELGESNNEFHDDLSSIDASNELLLLSDLNGRSNSRRMMQSKDEIDESLTKKVTKVGEKNINTHSNREKSELIIHSSSEEEKEAGQHICDLYETSKFSENAITEIHRLLEERNLLYIHGDSDNDNDERDSGKQRSQIPIQFTNSSSMYTSNSSSTETKEDLNAKESTKEGIPNKIDVDQVEIDFKENTPRESLENKNTTVEIQEEEEEIEVPINAQNKFDNSKKQLWSPLCFKMDCWYHLVTKLLKGIRINALHIGTLSRRMFLDTIRNPMLFAMHFLGNVYFSILLGCVYFNLQLVGFQSIQNRLGVILMSCIFLSFTGLSSLPLFWLEKGLYIHECVSNQYYSKIHYFLSKVLLDVVFLRMIPAVAFGVILHYMVNLRSDEEGVFPTHFIVMLATMVLLSSVSSVLNMALGMLVGNIMAGVFFGVIVVIHCFMLNNLFISFDSMTFKGFANFLQSISYLNFGYMVLVENELVGSFATDFPEPGLTMSGDNILSYFHIPSNTVFEELMNLLIYFIVAIIITYVILAIYVKEKR